MLWGVPLSDSFVRDRNHHLVSTVVILVSRYMKSNLPLINKIKSHTSFSILSSAVRSPDIVLLQRVYIQVGVLICPE